MSHSWTGGQYSVVRALYGTQLVLFALPSAPDPTALAICCGGLAFALGWGSRVVGIALTALLGVSLASGRGLDALVFAVPLIAHVFVPPAPYGSLPARGRVDPAGDWALPSGAYLAHWLGVVLLVVAVHGLLPSGITLGLAAVVLVGAASPARALTWFALFAATIIFGIYHATAVCLPLSFLLFAFDPAWIPARRSGNAEIMFYDGSCGLCHNSVRLLLAEDGGDPMLTFAPLGGATANATLPNNPTRPDSVVIWTGATEKHRSAAVLHMLTRLGGLWHAIGLGLGLIPRPLRDALYNGIAAIRHRLFARPKEACPLLPPPIRKRMH